MADSPILLSELITELRRELEKAQRQRKKDQLRLLVDEAEIELQIAVTRKDVAGGGIKVWVFNAEA